MKLENEILDEYKAYLLEDGKSSATIESYMGDIKSFTEYLKNKDSIFKGQIKRFYISSYKEYLLSERYKVSTINKKVNSLHSFNIFLIKTSRMTESVVNISRDKIKIAHGSDKSVEVLTDNEVEKILFHIEDEVKVNQRDRMIILILLYTGLRVSELVNIKIDRINFLSSHLEVIGKGGKYREVPLKQEVVKAMKKYLEEDRAVSKYKDSEYLIVTQRDGKAHRDAILKMVKRIGKELDIKIYNHKFRHTFCTRLIKRGVPLTTVSAIVGHSSIDTTVKFYTNVSRHDKKCAIDAL
jgi:integrase/recombinase XerD